MKRNITNILCLAIIAVTVTVVNSERKLVEELSINLNGYSIGFPDDSTKNIYETSGRFIPRNVIPTRANIHTNHALMALPRYKPGVPFTLGVLTLDTNECNPQVTPFPCWAIQEEGNCQALQNAVDVAVDIQEILWILDIGIVNTMEQPVRRCPPKIVGLNLVTERVIKVIDLSPLVNSWSRLQYLTVDYGTHGDVHVYVADAGGRAIIVYNINEDKGYRVVLPKAVSSGSEKKDALYIALVKRNGGQSILYFSYLNSRKIYSISAANLRTGNATGAIVEVGVKPRKLVILGTDNGCAIFFRYKGESDVYMWNSNTPFIQENFLLVQKGNDNRLPTQVMPGFPGFSDLVWVLESNFQDYIQNTVSCSGASVGIHPLLKTCDD